jgi:hypothetical protein
VLYQLSYLPLESLLYSGKPFMEKGLGNVKQSQ